MKSQGVRIPHCLQLLLHINTLRQDCAFFAKLLLFNWDNIARQRYFQQLFILEQERIKRQDQLLLSLRNVEINEQWRTQLFTFSNRIAKVAKNFHLKLLNVSIKLGEVSQSAVFLQQFRNACIQKLSEVQCVGPLLEHLADLLRKRFFSQTNTFLVNPSKMIELLKKQESNKTNRYLFLIKDFGASLFLQSQRKAMLKLDIEIRKLKKENEQNCHPFSQFESLLDLQEEVNPDVFFLQNGMKVTLNYFEEGFCQFLVSKWQRMFKYFKNKNELNEKTIDQFCKKYISRQRKNKYFSLKQYSRNNTLSVNNTRHDDSNMEISHFNTSFDVLKPTTDNNQRENSQKKIAFRVSSIASRKRSHTLKPLAELKQNKEAFPQKIIHMKMTDDVTPLTIKNVRIRRKRAFLTLKDQTYWSLLMNGTHQKLTIHLH